jgi:hypothetical protein
MTEQILEPIMEVSQGLRLRLEADPAYEARMDPGSAIEGVYKHENCLPEVPQFHDAVLY